jgi:putative RNA 2'-phosphotransferase
MLLYRPVGLKELELIAQSGFKAFPPRLREQPKMSRHHVHLSVNVETARKVGMRHGSPVVLTVNAAEMHQAGYPFYCSANGVWLVDKVPPEFLTVLKI